MLFSERPTLFSSSESENENDNKNDNKNDNYNKLENKMGKKILKDSIKLDNRRGLFEEDDKTQLKESDKVNNNENYNTNDDNSENQNNNDNDTDNDSGTYNGTESIAFYKEKVKKLEKENKEKAKIIYTINNNLFPIFSSSIKENISLENLTKDLEICNKNIIHLEGKLKSEKNNKLFIQEKIKELELLHKTADIFNSNKLNINTDISFKNSNIFLSPTLLKKLSRKFKNRHNKIQNNKLKDSDVSENSNILNENNNDDSFDKNQSDIEELNESFESSSNSSDNYVEENNANLKNEIDSKNKEISLENNNKINEIKDNLINSDENENDMTNPMNEYMKLRAAERKAAEEKKSLKKSEKKIRLEQYEKEWNYLAKQEQVRKKKIRFNKKNGLKMNLRHIHNYQTTINSVFQSKGVSVVKQRSEQNENLDHKDTYEDTNDNTINNTMDNLVKNKAVNLTTEQNNINNTSHGSVNLFDGDNIIIDKMPLPPAPNDADLILYQRQQARLKELHEMNIKKQEEIEKANTIRKDISVKIGNWAKSKTFPELLLTITEICHLDGLEKYQDILKDSIGMDTETVKKAYRMLLRIIHPDKLRDVNIAEKLEAQELFSLMNRAFDAYRGEI